MKAFILSTFMLLTTAAAAPSASVKNLTVNGINTPYLVGDSPQEITDVMKGLFTLSTMTEPNTNSPRLETIECVDKDHPSALATGALCGTPVQEFLPVAFRHLMNQHLTAEGPNCWNAALVATGLISEIRHTDGVEFSSYMHSNLCTPILDPRAVEAGDIIAIRNRDQGEYHGMVYVSPKHVFTKNGQFQNNHYTVVPNDNTYAYYGVDSETCRFQADIPDTATCPKSWANVYRCRK